MKIAVPMMGFGRAGGYRVLSRLASQWHDMGHDVVMLADRHSAQPYFPVSCPVLWIDGRGRAADWIGSQPCGPLARRCYAAARLWAIRAALERYCRRHDVILANHSLSAIPVRWAAVRAKKFYYIQAYEPECFALESTWTSPILMRLSQWSYRLNLRRIVNAPLYCNYRGIRSRHVVPPGLDLSLFHPADPPSPRQSGRFVIGCIGRKEPGKGTRYVVEAFRLLSADPRYVLRVAYGNLPDECRDWPGVEIVVPANDAELADYYRSVDVMAAPGTIQMGAFHYPVMEAMACGIPVITTGCSPATRENAWIVPVADARAIAEAIVAIADRPETALERIRRAKEDIRPFSWPSVAASMLSIFERADRAA
jgi:glycosyltransferase involved in cell wall biosynthesis